MNGKKQILLPLIESLDEVNCTTVKICMVNGKIFEKEMQNSQVHFTIIPRRPSCVNSNQVSENSASWVAISGDWVIASSID